MKLSIFVKGTKIKLTQPWEVHTGLIYRTYNKGEFKPSEKLFDLPKGTVLSIHDIDIRGNANPSKCVSFYICKGGCPGNISLEQKGFSVSLAEALNCDFELNSKADYVLNDLGKILEDIDKEIKNN